MNKLEEIKNMFAEKVKVDNINPNMELKALGLDSLDLVELIMDIEEKYGVELDEISYQSGVTRRSKILVLGQLSGKVKDYQLAAKKLGVREDNLEFVDYDGAKRLSAERLRYSCEYSDIICGPIPHKIEGMGDTSSFIAEMERNPSEYPKLIKATANESLKFSISGFKENILKTRFFEEIVEGF